MGWTLCDRAGGGPGGGGGTGIPGSHLDCEVDLDRADVGVEIAPAEAARRAAGATWFSKTIESGLYGSGVCIEAAPLLNRNGGGGVWRKSGGEVGFESVSRLRVSEDSPNVRRSRDAPLPTRPGGGGKLVVCSGEGRWKLLPEGIRGTGGGGVEELEKCSKAVLTGRCCWCIWLLGGLYGGGGRGAVLAVETANKSPPSVLPKTCAQWTLIERLTHLTRPQLR